MQDGCSATSLAFKLVSCAVDIRIESGRSNFKSFLVCLRRQPLGQRPRPSAGRISCNVLSMNFIVLLQRSCAKPPVVFLLQNSIFAVGDQQRQKASRFSRIARIIRLRQYDAEFINQMGSLASSISIANMPHTRANQIPTPSIPFRMGIRLNAHQRAGPWNLGLVRTGPEARG